MAVFQLRFLRYENTVPSRYDFALVCRRWLLLGRCRRRPSGFNSVGLHRPSSHWRIPQAKQVIRCEAFTQNPVGSAGGMFNGVNFMNLIILLLVLLLLFGGGGFYFGGPVVGGSGLGLVLLICLIIFCLGGFREKI